MSDTEILADLNRQLLEQLELAHKELDLLRGLVGAQIPSQLN
jgi:hypothetical protein